MQTNKLRRLVGVALSPKTTLSLWGVLGLLAALTKMSHHRHNNFEIFRHSFSHFFSSLPLYTPYPDQYNDLFLYAPPFAPLMAPYWALGEGLGLIAWCLTLTGLLYYAIQTLPISQKAKGVIYWISAHDLLIALFMQQFNIAVAALIILSFSYALRPSGTLVSAGCVAVGTLTKLYGIVGLAFFPFLKEKGRWLLYLGGISVLLVGTTALLGGWDYTLSQWGAWFEALTTKAEGNQMALMQNISLLGMVRKSLGDPTFSDLLVVGPMLVLFALPYLRREAYGSREFRLLILAQTLLYVVILSNGSESSSYVTAMIGVALWYLYGAPRRPRLLALALLVGALLLTSFSYSDLFPRSLREGVIIPYALKALFPSLIALANAWGLLRDPFPSEIGEKGEKRSGSTISENRT